MPKHSKRYDAAREQVDPDTQYEPAEAVRLVKQLASLLDQLGCFGAVRTERSRCRNKHCG